MYLTTRFTTPVGTKPVNAPRVLCAGMLSFFFFNDTATTEIYTLSLHDALPILRAGVLVFGGDGPWDGLAGSRAGHLARSEEHTSELQSRPHLVCRLLLEKK